MRASSVLPLVCALVLSGCASKDFQEPGVADVSRESTKRVYRGAYADVWKAARAALDTRKYPAMTAQKESGVIVTDWVTGKSDRLFSGYGDTRIPYNIRFKLTVKFQPSRDGVLVSVESKEEYLSDSVTAGTDFAGSLYQWIPTESSTLKESAILSEIEAQMSKGQESPQEP